MKHPNSAARIREHFALENKATDKDVYMAFVKAVKALQAIADCQESDPARYVAKVDRIAVDALVALETF